MLFWLYFVLTSLDCLFAHFFVYFLDILTITRLNRTFETNTLSFIKMNDVMMQWRGNVFWTGGAQNSKIVSTSGGLRPDPPFFERTFL